MKLILGKVIEIKTTPEMEVFFIRACGVARQAYNLMVSADKECYDTTGKRLNVNAKKKEYNAVKRALYPYVYDSPKDANQQPFAHYRQNRKNAFDEFKKTGELHLPGFKCKGQCKNSFYLSNDQAEVTINSNKIHVPLLGEVELKDRFFPRQYDVYENKKRHKEHLKYVGFRFLSMTISEHGEKWFASISYEIEVKDQDPALKKYQPLIALDMNVLKYQTCDTNGELVPNPMNANAFKQAKNVKKKNSAFSRADGPHILKQKPSKTKKPYKTKLDRIVELLEKNKEIRKRNKELKETNKNVLYDTLEKEFKFLGREEKRKQMRKAYLRLTNIVDEFYKELALKIVRENQAICIEDLGLVEMRQNHHVASKFMCAAFGKLRKWIEHFALIYGTTIIYADKYFPSSKQCSSCHHVNHELTYEKTWSCPSCKKVHDRDENAAINLLNYLIDVLSGKFIRPEATGLSSSTTSGVDNDQLKWAYAHNYAEMYQRTFFDIY